MRAASVFPVMTDPAKVDCPPGVRQIGLLLSRTEDEIALSRGLPDLEVATFDHQALDTGVPRLPDLLIVDKTSATQHLPLLTRLRHISPGLLIMLLHERGSSELQRVPREIGALLPIVPQAQDMGELAKQIQSHLADQPGRAATVLLVEDEQNLRDLAAYYLLLQGYAVFQAEDGQEAMTIFEAHQPDLILSDLYMPRMNGFKLLMEVKNRTPAMPLLMMTGYSSAAQAVGMTRYSRVSLMPKPFRLTELGRNIRTLLEE
jgi:CheY-like chemotaxis protein